MNLRNKGVIGEPEKIVRQRRARPQSVANESLPLGADGWYDSSDSLRLRKRETKIGRSAARSCPGNNFTPCLNPAPAAKKSHAGHNFELR